MKKLIAILVFTFALISCEKDDICPEGSAVTPRLIVTFYDNIDPTEKKDVDNLLVYGVNDNNEAVFFNNITISTTDSIAVPLRNDLDFTKLVFHRDIENSDFETGNLDFMIANYSREEVYISRACGYVNNFVDLTTTIETDSNNWILDSEIINSNLENETSAHVKIFH